MTPRLILAFSALCALLASPAFSADKKAPAREEIPREAARRMARGRAAFKDAKTPEELAEAAKEFQLAAEAAPRWPDPVFNQAQALEKAGDAAGAKTAYEKYLELAPKAADAAAVRERIDELEFLAEKRQKEKERVVIEGDWGWESTTGPKVEVKLTGNELRVVYLPPHTPENDTWVRATLTGRDFEGRAWCELEGPLDCRARGSISEDNRRITWVTSTDGMPAYIRPHMDKDGDGWTDGTSLVRKD